MASNTWIAVAIAAVTTTTTLALTNYLLGRPWCIQLEPDGQQTIMYGNIWCAQRAFTSSPSSSEAHPSEARITVVTEPLSKRL